MLASSWNTCQEEQVLLPTRLSWYLGHKVDDRGIWALQRSEDHHRGSVTIEFSPTEDISGVSELLSEVLLPKLATVIQSFNDLLQKGRMWRKCTEAVETAKKLLTTSDLLVHYDSTLPLKLAANASQYGLGVACDGERKQKAHCICIKVFIKNRTELFTD